MPTVSRRAFRRIVLLGATSVGCLAISTTAQAAGDAETGVSDIVVTAQKRSESVLDVPIAITALSGDDLAKSQAFRLQDFVERVPGLQFLNGSGLFNQVVIRGVSAGDATITSTVASYIDETPYTAVGSYAGSTKITPNLDTYDMSRIEVLKGPQGTLYGSNALAGILKYVTNAPDVSGFYGSADSGINSVNHGGTGYDFHGMVNVPLNETTAVRVVGYYSKYAGYIDDPVRNAKNIDESRNYGFRGSLLFKPSSDVSIRLSALYQKRSYDDIGSEDVAPYTLTPTVGKYQHTTLVAQPGHVENQLYNITIDWDLQFAKLLSTSSYARYKLYDITDYTTEFGPYTPFFLGSLFGVVYPNTTSNKIYTQELRLASKDDKMFGWQVGGFFTKQNAWSIAELFPIDLATNEILYDYPENIGSFTFTPTYREFAGFANLEYHVTPAIDLAVGGRYSRIKQTFIQESGGFLGGVPFQTASNEGVWTYSADARWRFADKNMVYARVAKGYVPGGPNSVLALTTPTSYESSTTVNFEGGLKGKIFDNRVSYEVSAFHIKWSNIQLTAFVDGRSSITNGGTATSKGFEWNFTYVPITGLTFNVNGAYTHAKLTEATPASVGGLSGDRMPYSPYFQGSGSADYELPLSEQLSGFVGATWRYNGLRYGNFAADGPRQTMPSYNLVDLRAGVQSETWKFSVYVKNVGDARAVGWLYGPLGTTGVQRAGIAQPRTIGASLGFKF